ncbi:MAG: aldo/keto reductase [Phycisphaeraceae bacterium]|nr:aldo/keto reductase [Phycisphaeraceae bacterium]
MADKLRWGILGTGRIAKTLAKALKASSTGELVAVGSRTQESADKFGEEFKLTAAQRYGSYEGVVNDPRVQVVYISLPNHLHAPWTLRCAEAGKHILCEKPLAMNYPEAMTMAEIARVHNVFLMEAFMYRCHPQTARIVEIVRSGALGEVRIIQANFSFRAPDQWKDIRCVNEWGGGGIMDVGCYTASMTRLIAGAAVGKDFENPIEVKGIAQISPETRVDHWATATARFPGNILATLTCGMNIAIDSTLRVYGTNGNLSVPNPWFPAEKDNIMTLHRAGQEKPETIKVDGGAGLYSIEVDRVASELHNKQATSPAMSWADTISNMKFLDAWRRSAGLVWDTEKPDAPFPTIANRPLRPRANHNMPYGHVEGVNKPISRVVMGSMIFDNSALPLTHALLDNFVEIGGTCIDTAYIYGGGQCEQAVGKWIKNRGNREQIVILGKGGHTPDCNPEAITRQLHESLRRFGVDYIDLYVLHRDNPDLPVSVLVDVLNKHHREGKIRAFGGSNWTIQRIQEANDYAKKNGLVPFAASSPNFSLARWNKPTWDGCTTASDPQSREWFTRTQMPLFSWSSQANGFFTGRYQKGVKPVMIDDWYVNLLEPTWFNDDNFQRLERAQELAKKKGVTSTQIALAYVLNQPFPTFALIGPRTIEELRTSIEGVTLKLTAEELRYLNLES